MVRQDQRRLIPVLVCGLACLANLACTALGQLQPSHQSGQLGSSPRSASNRRPGGWQPADGYASTLAENRHHHRAVPGPLVDATAAVQRTARPVQLRRASTRRRIVRDAYGACVRQALRREPNAYAKQGATEPLEGATPPRRLGE